MDVNPTFVVYLKRILKSLKKDIEEVKKRKPEKGPKGEKGDRGERGPPGVASVAGGATLPFPTVAGEVLGLLDNHGSIGWIPQTGTGGGGSPNLDGGHPDSNYGGIDPIDGGTV